MTFLNINDISLSFAGVRALREINITVEKGNIHAIIGPNGAGKTSLFNCISGVYKPQQGSIQFDGQQLIGLKPYSIARLGIARMFQNLAIFEQLTVQEKLLLGRHHLFESRWYEEIFFSGKARSQEVAHRQKVEEIIEFLDLEKYRKMPTGILSYGVLKRVELGRALCMEPDLLLLDEPAAGLNQEETESLARYLLDIKEDLQITQLLIEHEMRFVFDLADKITVLDFGSKIAEGSADEIRQTPAVIEAYIGVGHGAEASL